MSSYANMVPKFEPLNRTTLSRMLVITMPASYLSGVNPVLFLRVHPSMQKVLDIGYAEGNLGRATIETHGSRVYGLEDYPPAA